MVQEPLIIFLRKMLTKSNAIFAWLMTMGENKILARAFEIQKILDSKIRSTFTT